MVSRSIRGKFQFDAITGDFEGFQSALGITRHLLAERLKKLVRQGVLRRIPY